MRRRDFIKAAAIGFPSIWIPSATANPFGGLISAGVSSAPGGGSCNTAQLATGTTFHSANNVADGARRYVGTKLTTVGGFTCCKVELPLYKIGSPVVTLQVSFWSHNAGLDEPDARLTGTMSDAVDSSTFGTTDPSGGTWTTFSNLSFALSATTIYWLMIEASALGIDASNCALWSRVTEAGARVARDDTGVSPWGIDSTTRGGMYRTFSA